jgi:CRP/FNR family transcriptional regulator, cyclic AMP receptor protein
MRWRLTEGVPDEELRRLLSIARRRRFARHEVVCHDGDPADSMHLIVKGRFAVQVRTPMGDTATLGLVGPGNSFGELALVTHEARRSATVTALEEAETFAVVKAEFDRLRHEYPSVNEVLLGFLAGELRRQHELLLEALYLPVERRLLRRLVELSSLYEDGVLPLTQDQLAELAGAARPTVNRVLREEQERGTIRLERGKTIILLRDDLARHAGLPPRPPPPDY